MQPAVRPGHDFDAPAPSLELRLADHAECRALTGLVEHLLERGQALGRTPRTVPAGAPLYHVGDRTDHLYLVRDGEVRESIASESGRELVLQVARPGETVGELCFCSVRERQESAVAVTDATVIPVYAEDVLSYVLKDPRAALEVLEYLFHRIGELSTRVQELAFQNVRERVIHHLLRMAGEASQRAAQAGQDADTVVLPRMTHEEWASRVYATREQVSGIFADLRRLGAVDYRPRSETVVHVAVLRRLAEMGPHGAPA